MTRVCEDTSCARVTLFEVCRKKINHIFLQNLILASVSKREDVEPCVHNFERKFW